MDILLNPNIAYLFLAGGLMLALLAVIAPGTGILEIIALACLFVAGYEIFVLPINYWALLVLLLGVAAFIFAVYRAKSLRWLAVSIVLLVFGSAYLFKSEIWWQPAVNPFLALIVSGLSAGFFWIAATKYLEAEQARPVHDAKNLIGAVGEAKTRLNPEGSIQVGGELWTARSSTMIPIGSQVRVVGKDGFVLEVEPVESKVE